MTVFHLPIQIERVRHPELADQPLLIYSDGAGQQPLVFDADPALAIGAQTPLGQALIAHPEAAVLAADPVWYRLRWRALTTELVRQFPQVEDSGPGCAYIDVDGLSELYGGQESLSARLLAAIPEGWQVQLGIGPSKFSARCAAQQAGRGQTLVVPSNPAAGRAFLADQPLTLLPLAGPARRLLADFGLRTLGDVADQPRAALHARLGQEGSRAWALASGRDDDHLRPIPVAATVAGELEFPFPAVSSEAFSIGLLTLLQRLYQRPVLSGRAAGRASLTCQICDLPAFALERSFKKPAVTAQHAHFALLAALAGLDDSPLGLPGPVASLHVELGALSTAPTVQTQLWRQSRKQDLQVALAGLSRRLASSALLRVVEVEPWSRIPERRQALIRFTDP